ncbi:hypothetical protein [Algoriphagus boseongensis]|nr:hypothetical protein [Algoriphagus boseongensis]
MERFGYFETPLYPFKIYHLSLMNPNKLYQDSFYKSRNSETENSAIEILSLLFSFFKPNSMVDFGCGVGTWLKTGNNLGVREILGIEGEWLKSEYLVIPQTAFLTNNLTSKIILSRKFDLAISLEVAEHIEEKYSKVFIENLTKASDVVLFSAAIPGQRGSGHVNEQWPDYWIKKFKEKDYLPLDLIRPKIWQNDNIKTWYKQNTILFVKRERLEGIPELKAYFDPLKSNWSLVHPSTFLRQIEISHPKYSSLSKLIKSFPVVFLNSIKSNIKKLI